VRSLDGGVTWSYLTVGGRIAFHPSAPNVIYAASAAGIFKSVDGGDTFSHSDSGIPADAGPSSIAIDPNVSSTLYAGAGPWLYKSIDAGASWNLLQSLGAPLRLTAVGGSPSTIYAGFATGLSMSQDGGATWTTGGGLEGRWVPYVAAGPTPGRLYAGTQGAGVFRSDDFGATWSQRTAGLKSCWAYSVAIDPTDPRRVVAALDGGGIARTTDAGETWQPGNTGFSRLWARSVAIDPFVPTTMYAGVGTPTNSSGPSLFKSGDGGGSWFPIGGYAMLSLEVRSLATDPAHPETLLAGTQFGGLKLSADGGLTWNYSNTGVAEKITFDPSQPDIVWAASTYGAYKSIDGGHSFEARNNGLEDAYGFWITAIAVDPTSSNTLYASKHFGYPIFKSVDGGDSWFPSSGGISSEFGLLDVIADPVEPNTLYAGGGGGVWVTHDGGSNWTPMSDGIGGYPIVLSLAIDAGGRMLHAGTRAAGVAEFQLHFFDVDAGDPFRDSIEALAIAGVTTGCGHGDFCPTSSLTRAQAAVWLLKARHGSAYTPPIPSGAVFSDVPADAFAAAWIEGLAGEGMAAGCGGGLFCPDSEVTRAQLAVWLLRAEHGPTYAPPPATGAVFADVPADAFAAAWIEQLAAEGITSGCGGGNFCPTAATTRSQSAVLLVRTFALD
jgi:photosystem II stability/assembly factor-like uncharacterized protein